MNIEVTKEQKTQMIVLTNERQVLRKLIAERQAIIEQEVQKIMEANKLDFKMYDLHFDIKQDKWEAHLRPGVLTIPTPKDKKIIKTN